MSDAMDTLEAIVALEGEIERLRADLLTAKTVNAALVEALEMCLEAVAQFATDALAKRRAADLAERTPDAHA
jgi:hypothetical protein